MPTFLVPDWSEFDKRVPKEKLINIHIANNNALSTLLRNGLLGDKINIIGVAITKNKAVTLIVAINKKRINNIIKFIQVLPMPKAIFIKNVQKKGKRIMNRASESGLYKSIINGKNEMAKIEKIITTDLFSIRKIAKDKKTTPNKKNEKWRYLIVG